MLTLPNTIISLLTPFSTLFHRRTWLNKVDPISWTVLEQC